MERYLKVEDAANKSEELRKTITLIQDAETRIKQVIFHSFLTQDHVEATIVRIIEETVKDLPENADKDKYAEDLKSNANHWLVIVKHSGMVLDALGTGTPRVLMPTDKAEYKQIAALFERGQPREANYQQEVLRLTKTIAKEMAGTSFKSSTVDYKGLTMRTNISLRAAAERRIRDQIHHDDNARVIAENVLVWISGHVDCSDRCEPWQSKLYSTNGKTGTIEGHKYIPLETAINSNWVTTKAGKRWNNSILEGFNCRHYTIPFVPGTVPVIKYDPKIVARERAITARMRKMERDIITGKTLHRLLVEAERDNKLNLPKHAISDTKRQVVEMYRQMNAQYQAYCNDNDRAYYPWRTQIQVDRSKNKQNYVDTNENEVVVVSNKEILVNKKELAKVTEERHSLALRIEPKLTKDIVTITESVGAKNPGLESRLKTRDSLLRKIKTEYADLIANGKKITLREVANDIKDTNRYTAVLKADSFAEDYYSINEKLEYAGYNLYKVKNTFKIKGATYKGVNNNYVDPNGVIFELQFHTRESFELKNGILHELYKKARDINTSEKDKVQLEEKMKKLSSLLTTPKGIDTI